MTRIRAFPWLVAICAACGPAASSADPDWSAEIIDSNEQLLNQGNIAAARNLFAENYLLHATGGDQTGGPQLIESFVSDLRTAFPDLHVEVEILVTEGNRVAWVRRNRGTHQSDFMGVPATGRVVVWQDIVVTRYENGLIAEEWGASDLAERLRAQ
jgi:steroid delta-isomerase-like uncharacterized protein